jgi:hypothetical protein
VAGQDRTGHQGQVLRLSFPPDLTGSKNLRRSYFWILNHILTCVKAKPLLLV